MGAGCRLGWLLGEGQGAAAAYRFAPVETGRGVRVYGAVGETGMRFPCSSCESRSAQTNSPDATSPAVEGPAASPSGRPAAIGRQAGGDQGGGIWIGQCEW